MTTKDEAFQQYEKELAKIDKQAYEEREAARTILREQLESLQAEHHKELKAIQRID